MYEHEVLHYAQTGRHCRRMRAPSLLVFDVNLGIYHLHLCIMCIRLGLVNLL